MLIKIIPVFILLISQTLFAAEDSIYNFNWLDDDETVYVIQNKEYPTTKRVELNLSATVSSNNSPYQSTLSYNYGLTYYLSDVYSVDLIYKKYINSNTTDLNSLIQNTGKKPIVRVVDTIKLMHFNWLPFYGKINTLNKIFYFYMGIGIGVGTLKEDINIGTWDVLTVTEIDFDESRDTFAGSLKIFAKFFLAQNWNFGIELEYFGYNTLNAAGNQDVEAFNMYGDTTVTFGYLF